MKKYKINKLPFQFVQTPRGERIKIDTNIFVSALKIYHEKISMLYNMKFDIAALLGMRNLSAAIGELYVQSLEEAANGLFIKNPNQDGYPDLLLMDAFGKGLYNKIKQENLLQEKNRFSPFEGGGIEVKATCGSVPTQAMCNKKGVKRPELGDNRIDLLKGYDWKAHHRETNNLAGLTWDFIDCIPTITSIQYSAELSERLWGDIVQPTAGGGRTTSVSIMTREGVATMYKGWIAIIDDPKYISFFNKYNE